MARFNALLQSLARPPAFQQGLFDAARGIGATPVMLGAQRQAAQRKQEIQDSLRQNANNPEALEQFANQYLMQGREDVAKAFSNAAEAARRRKEREAAALSEKGEMALFNMARMMQSAPDEDISRNSLKTQNYLSLAEGYGVGPERALQILDQSVDKGSDAKGYKVEKDIEIDGKLIAVADFFDAEGNFLRRREIGPVPEKTGSEGTKTLAQQLEDAGVPEVDLTTLSGAKQARRDIIAITGNASLANAVGNIIDDLTPLSVKEGLDIVRSTNPEFVEAENLREQTSRFATLANISDQDIAGLSALIERTLTATTENDIKAVSELDRFRKAKDLPQRIKDFASELALGRLSDETIQEYSTLAAAFEELAEMRMSRALDAMIVNGSPKESDAAQRAKNQILGISKARIIPN